MESILVVTNFACAMYVCGRTVRAGCNIQFVPSALVREMEINRKCFSLSQFLIQH